ncbi:MAG: AAA family ATPase, partial [Pseudobdellovibrionaceae bacterium]|nr:AAA family ATPase [Pseudobdellovibrionaceae bacterium]
MQYKRIIESPKQSFFLFGPRGTGKSTWLRHVFAADATFNLLDERLYQSYLRDPGIFARELFALETGAKVVIDEIQRLPNLLNEVHRFIEEKNLTFALSGSSARKLKKEGVNLLAGRALRRMMFPFLPEELGKDFDLETVLRYGSIAVIWMQEDRREALEAYVQMYLKEEIQAEALVRNLSGFARFLPIAGLCHGQVVNFSNIARDAGVARTTVHGYVEILQDTLVVFLLPAFEAKLRVRERNSPKLYWIDPGLVRSVKNHHGPVAQEERGSLFEGWIASVLYAYQSYRKLFDSWSYCCPTEADQLEVDFLLEKSGRFIAIEVKSTQNIHNNHFRGLRAIKTLPNLQACLV